MTVQRHHKSELLCDMKKVKFKNNFYENHEIKRKVTGTTSKIITAINVQQ